MARKGMSLKDIDISSSIDDNDKILLQSGDKTSSTSVCNLKDKILDSTIPSDDISRIVSDSINGINRAYDSGKETVDRYGIKSISDNILEYINNNFMVSTSRICNSNTIKPYDSNITSDQINESSKLKSIVLANFSPISIDVNISKANTSISGYKMFGKFDHIANLKYTFKFNIESSMANGKTIRIIDKTGKDLSVYGLAKPTTEPKTVTISVQAINDDMYIIYDAKCTRFDFVGSYINYDDTLTSCTANIVDNRFTNNIKSNYIINAHYKNMLDPNTLPNNKYYDFDSNAYRVIDHTITEMDGSVPKNAQVIRVDLEPDKYYTISGLPQWRQSNILRIVQETKQTRLAVYKEIGINDSGYATFYSSANYVNPVLYLVLYDGSEGEKDLCTSIQLEEGTQITEFYNYRDTMWQINPKIQVNEKETLEDGTEDYRTVVKLNSLGCIRDELFSNGKLISNVSILDKEALSRIEVKKKDTNKYPNCDVYEIRVNDAPSYAMENGLINIIMYDNVNNKVILPKVVNEYKPGLYIIANTITWVVEEDTDISNLGTDLIIVYKKYMPTTSININALELSADLRKIDISSNVLPIKCNYLSPYTEVVGTSSESAVNILDGIIDDTVMGYIDYKSFAMVVTNLLERINTLTERVSYLEDYSTLVPEDNV